MNKKILHSSVYSYKSYTWFYAIQSIIVYIYKERERELKFYVYGIKMT